MKHITQEMVAPIIRGFDKPFDTHDVEQLTLRRNTEAFARELLMYRNAGDPLLRFSAQFGKWIDYTFQQQAQEITKTRKVKTENLGGTVCSNQQWRRV